MNNTKVVIMAGGRGTRIASINSEVPKPMIPILNKPILEYEIDCLKKNGLKDLILVIGYLGNQIKEYFKDGSQFGVNIEYIIEDQPLGTAGSLYYLKDKIKDDFILLNGDIIFDVDFARFMDAHKANNCVATILTHPNSHPYDSGIIVSDKSKRVLNWLHKEDERKWYKNRVNAGLHILSPKIFNEFKGLKKCDLDRDILKPLISQGELYCYDSPEYIKDMGTPDRYYSVIEDIKSGKVEAKNLRNKQKAIFLDRDGTINKYVGFLTNIDQFELLPGVADAIKRINDSEYMTIVVTNQPVIARGEVTYEELDEIHNKMETLLGLEGAYIDSLYYCPHHPDKGFEGEIKELKIECECRKPKPGMLLQASKDFNIDLEESYMIGDTESDKETGMNAHCKKSFLVNEAGLLSCITKIIDD